MGCPFDGKADESRQESREQNALTEEKRGKKHLRMKVRYIILAVLVLIVLAAGYFSYVNRSNISAAYTLYVTKKNGGDIQTLQQENDERIRSILSRITETKIRDLTAEEAEMLRRGELTGDEAIELLTGNASTIDEAKRIVRERKAVAKSIAASKKDAVIAQIYVLRAVYSGQIEGLIANAINEYNALPDDRKNTSAKAGIIDSLISRGNALEGQCDAQMEGLLANLTSELQRLGEDTGIISEIRAAYVQEKRIKKAAMLNAYR